MQLGFLVRTAFSALAAAIVLMQPALAEDFGQYIGHVVAKWLDDGRKMQLVRDFEYVGPDRTHWKAPHDSVVDGASIPRFAWSIIGGPFEGKYRDASVIHDVACDERTRPWQAVHRAFFTAMEASNVDPVTAKIMYSAVYHFGPRWPSEIVKRGVPLGSVPDVSAELKSAAPSDQSVEIKVYPIRRTNCPTGMSCSISNELPPTHAVVVARIAPPQPTLAESDFERLKAFIKEHNPSLSEIDSYRP